MKNTLKVLYIFLAGIGVFFIQNLYLLAGIICFHILIYFFIRNPKKNLRFLKKIKWFVLIIFLSHALTGENDYPILHINAWDWTLGLSKSGIYSGALMAGKLIAMLTVTQIVRFSMDRKAFTKGLTGLGLSHSSAEIIDEIITIIHAEKKNNGGGGGKGKGKNKNNKQPTDKKETNALNVLIKGKIGNIPKKLSERLNYASEQFENSPNSSIGAAALAIALIRLVKIAPGLPVAPGHKNILIFPAFIYGILKSEKRFAGLQIGAISGILHFIMGFGKFGPIGIIEFALIGGVIDLTMRLPFKKNNLIFLMVVGALTGVVRIFTEIALATLLLPPDKATQKVFYLIYLPYFISQVAFGTASGFVSKALLNRMQHE